MFNYTYEYYLIPELNCKVKKVTFLLDWKGSLLFRTGTTIPTPGQTEETIDYKTKAQYVLNKEEI